MVTARLGVAGVGYRGGVGPEAHRHAGAVRLGQVDDGLGERMPLEVGFGADEQQHVVAGDVAPGLQLDRMASRGR